MFAQLSVIGHRKINLCQNPYFQVEKMEQKFVVLGIVDILENIMSCNKSCENQSDLDSIVD